MDIRLTIERNGMTLINLPIWVVILAAVMAPRLAVLSAILALVTGCNVRMERNPGVRATPYHHDHMGM
ncbi:MAG: DUF4342 domain-containing protein [Candidatus Fimadaptatus sp.]